VTSYFLGVDIGTSTVKAIITDVEGKIYAYYSVSSEINIQKPGWVEQDPEIHWWRNFVKAVKGCLKESNVSPKEIIGIGLSGLSVNLTPIDKKGKIIRPSILYMDTRAIKEIEWLQEKVGNQVFLDINGNPISHRMLIPKILWFKKHENENYKRTWKILVSSHSYIVYKLCGRVTADYYVADMTGLSDYRHNTWSEDISSLTGIEIDKLPDVFPSHHVVGEISVAAADETGLAEGTPIIVGSADGNLSALSAGVVNPGDAMITYASAGAAYIYTEQPKPHPKLYFGHYVKPNSWVSVIGMSCTGSLVKWFLKQFVHAERELKIGIDPYEAFDMRAEKVPPGSAGIIVLPYFMGERSPIMDPKARGVIFGLNLYHTKEHIYRAILEAFGYGLMHHLDILREINVQVNRWIAVNGGARSKIWRQIVSDVTGIPQEYPIKNPGAPLGDAFLAAIGTNTIKDWNRVKEWVSFGERTEPDKEKHEFYKKLYLIYRRLYEHLKDDMRDLSDIISK
jgi:xylulokinase